MAQDIRVTEPRLKAVVKAIFAAAGSDERECGLAADHLVEANPGIEILRFDDYSSLLQAMVSGQIDAMGGGDYGEIYLRKGSKGEEYEQKFPLRAAHFGIGIRRGNPELLQWLNTFVYAIKNTGELDAISKKWRNGAPMIPLPVF